MRSIDQLSDTWDNINIIYVGISIDIEATDYDPASDLMRLETNSTEFASVSHEGNLHISGAQSGLALQSGTLTWLREGANGTVGFNFNFTRNTVAIGGPEGAVLTHSDGSLSWSAHPFNVISLPADAVLQGIGRGVSPAGVISLTGTSVFGASVQQSYSLHVYDDYTNTANYSRLNIGSTDTAFELVPVVAGTGTELELHISGFPTTNPGPGILWNNGGLLAMGT